ncbi:MAG: LpxI family protein [Pyramidobacter sp.]|jgi:DUF1009 family protein
MSAGKLALVAGEGELPLEILRAMKNAGDELPEVYFFGDDDEPFRQMGVNVQKVGNALAIAMTLTKMKLRGVKRLMMAGRVPKKNIYEKQSFDSGAEAILSTVAERSDHELLAGVVRYVEKFGIAVMGYKDVIPQLMAPEGHIAGPLPTQEQLADCRYGVKILKALLPLSFGQSIVVSDRAVVAVEALEGTDMTIQRAGVLKTGGILIKGIRADQDRRYDIPVVGVQTLRSLADAGLTGLFIEAENVLILHRREFADEAERLKISVMGVPSCQFS